MDAVLWSVFTNANLAAIVVPLLQVLRHRQWVPVRLARVVSAAAAAVLAAGITYTFDSATGDFGINLYAALNALPLFTVEFAKQFGLQEGFYRLLRKLFETPPPPPSR